LMKKVPSGLTWCFNTTALNVAISYNFCKTLVKQCLAKVAFFCQICDLEKILFSEILDGIPFNKRLKTLIFNKKSVCDNRANTPFFQ